MSSVIEPVESADAVKRYHDVEREGVEERPGDPNLVHEEEMPEGPTVTRWEEWA